MINYKAIYRELIRKAHRKGLCVKAVNTKVTRDFVGMNPYAAKEFGIKRFSANMIWIDSDLNYRDKCVTLNHEIIEFGLMKRGWRYWTAHKGALKLERRLRDGIS